MMEWHIPLGASWSIWYNSFCLIRFLIVERTLILNFYVLAVMRVLMF